MGEITFIRHGQASFGKGDYDVLSATGREQSVLLARYLMECGSSYDAACCGTLKRQSDTAEIVLGEMAATASAAVPGLAKIEGLNEYQSDEIMKHYIPIVLEEDPDLTPYFEKMFSDKKSFQKIFEKVMAKWLAGESQSDAVEGWSEFKYRVNAAVEGIIRENDKDARVIAFSSGGAISACVHIATGMSPFEAIRLGWGLVNTSVTRFRYGSTGLILHSFNCYPHLEHGQTNNLVTYR